MVLLTDRDSAACWSQGVSPVVTELDSLHFGRLVCFTLIVTVLITLLSLRLSVRLGQPVVEGPDPSQHLAPFPRSQPEVDPHLPAALCPRLRVCGGHRLQQVRPQGHISLLRQLSYFLMNLFFFNKILSSL